MTLGIRVITGISLTAAMVVLIGYGWIIASTVKPAGPGSVADWLQLLLPVVPAVVVFAGFFLGSRSWAAEKTFSWVLAGVLGASVLYLGVPLYFLATRFNLLVQDGTAFWGLAFIPTLYVWLPGALIGALTGAAISTVIRGRNKTS